MNAINFIEKVSDRVFKIEKVLVTISLILMFISLTSGVIFRYFFNSPLFWSDEISIFSLIFITFVGGSMTIKRQQSAAVTILVDNLKENHQRIIISIGFFLLSTFGVLVLYYSFVWLSSPNIALQKSSSMQVPMLYPYLSIPLGFLFMSIHSISLFLKSLRISKEEQL